jgi:dTDP-4-dehydrorhamnose 3,5-epimerase
LNIRETKLPGVLIFEPRVFHDERGFFLETFRKSSYRVPDFVQDNMSYSQKGVLRGLHYQNPNCQGKLISVVRGEIMDVAVDIRAGSPTFGQWVSETLSDENHLQIYVPPGYAHGFLVLSQMALVAYKCTDYYDAASEGAIRWNDPEIGIDWPIEDPILGPKDAAAPALSAVPPGKLAFPNL